MSNESLSHQEAQERLLLQRQLGVMCDYVGIDPDKRERLIGLVKLLQYPHSLIGASIPESIGKISKEGDVSAYSGT